MSRLNGEQLAEAFGDSVNNFNFDKEAFVKGFAKQHRTLQQSMLKAMLACVEKASEPDYGRDGRNEASHQTCKKLIKGWQNETKAELIASDGYWTEKRVEDYINNPIVKPSNLPTI